VLPPAPDQAQDQERLLAQLAHELRNSLNAITMSAGMLSQTATLPAPSERQVLLIRRASDRMSRLITNALDEVSILAHGLQLTVEPQPIAPAIADGARAVALAATGRNVALELPPEAQLEALPPCPIHRARLTQAISNLLGVSIDLAAPASAVVVATQAPPGRVALFVSAPMPALAEADLPRLFDREYWGGRSAGFGHGLALRVALEIARAHGGTITASGDAAGRRSFQLDLPAPVIAPG
jgi:sigma-B regulation protein RsbU (phosphoserine phosphatase)